jgi:hypothetical protein
MYRRRYGDARDNTLARASNAIAASGAVPTSPAPHALEEEEEEMQG